MLARARALFPNAPLPCLDLSTGINPVAYPAPAITPEALHRLPDQDEISRLEAAAATAFGAPDPACVVAGPGTQIFISLLPRLFGQSDAKVAVLSPTYGEHAIAWAGAGFCVTTPNDLDALADADIAVLCRPNNPDGRVVPRQTVLALADDLANRGGVVVVDEAFVDLEDETRSLADAIGHPGLILLRSFGKWSGLAGVRLGFLLAAPSVAARLRAAIGPWAVSGPALAAGLAAIPDATWRAEARARLAQDAIRLQALLIRQGLQRVGGTHLFQLYEGPNAQAIWRRFGEAGILVRSFNAKPSWLRFGLPPEWSRLPT